ncbi:MAG: hypothetical protein R3B13_39535 [Polyangiaceae bacterium]
MLLNTGRFAALAGVLLLSGQAHAQADTAKCIEAHSQSQKLRADGKLRAAREQLLICAQSSCPQIARNDCTGWLGEVEKEVPSIVFRARTGDGNDAVEVRVLMDGEELAKRLDGRAVSVEPGPHQFRFELAGHPAVERQLVIIVGERNRAITIDFEPAGTTPQPEPKPDTQPEPETATGGGIPTATWIFGGIGVAGLAGFTYFSLKGRSDEDDLSSCKPNCTDDAVSDVERTYLFGDISLAVGVVSLGAATYFLLTDEPNKKPSTTGYLAPTLGGAQLGVVGSF